MVRPTLLALATAAGVVCGSGGSASAQTALPGAPQDFAVAVTGGCAAFSWQPPMAGGVVSTYTIVLGSSPGSADLAAFPVESGLSYARTLPAGTYFGRVRGVNAGGTGPASNEVTVSVPGGQACPPDGTTPQNLRATVSFDRVTFAWDPPTAGATPTGYVVTWRPTGFVPPGGSAQVTTLTHTARIAAGSYRATVVALRPLGVGDPSSEIAFTTTTPPPVEPGPPSALAATISGARVAFAWNAPTTGGAVDRYVLEAGFAPNRTDAGVLQAGPVPGYAVDGVPSGRYFVRVRAANDFGAGAASNEVEVLVGSGGTPPGPPSALVATIAGTTVTLAWQVPVSGDPVTNYVIEAGLSPNRTDAASVQVGPVTTFQVAGVVPGLYFVRVKAVNASGLSGPSNEVQVAVGGAALPGAPTALQGVVVGQTVTLTWSAPSTGGAPAEYVLEAGRASGLTNVIVSGTGSTLTTFSAAGVPPGQYFVRVRARNALGLSGPSNEVVVSVSPDPQDLKTSRPQIPPASDPNFVIISR